MPFTFDPQSGAVVDQAANLAIYAPRMLPASPPEPPDHTEYQFGLYQGEDRHGFGLFGWESARESGGGHQRLVVLDLGRDWVIDAALKLKRRLDNTDDDLRFLRHLSKGLLAARALRRESGEDITCQAVTNAQLLAERGIEVPDTLLTRDQHNVLLAEISTTDAVQMQAELDLGGIGREFDELTEGRKGS